MNEIISIEEVEVQSRGRKKVIDAELANDLANLVPGQAIVLSETFGQVKPSKRSQIAQTIRKHWADVRGDKCRIDWTADGVAQVRVREVPNE